MNINIKNIANCKRTKDETPVQNNLSTTPRQMAELTSRGESVSSATVDLLDAHTIGVDSWVLPLEFRRGVDISDSWNASQDAKRKFRNAEIINNQSQNIE